MMSIHTEESLDSWVNVLQVGLGASGEIWRAVPIGPLNELEPGRASQMKGLILDQKEMVIERISSIQIDP
jgi:hypothetical protein